MELSFCKECDNVLTIYENQETKKLHNCCKACGNIEDIIAGNKPIYSNNNKLKFNTINIINSNSYITHDITLPVIKGNTNIKCKNGLCDSEVTDISYIKYDSTNMKYIYICKHCGAKWSNTL